MGEFDTPANLVANKRSLLMGFIYKTGAGSSRHLVGIANANVGCETDTDGSAANTPPLSTSGGDGDISGDDGGESGAEKPIAEVAVSVAAAVTAAVAAGGRGGGLSPIVADVGTRQATPTSPSVRGRADSNDGGESGRVTEIAVAAVAERGRGSCPSPIAAGVGARQAIPESSTVGAEEATDLVTIGEGEEARRQGEGVGRGGGGNGGGSASCRGESPRPME